MTLRASALTIATVCLTFALTACSGSPADRAVTLDGAEEDSTPGTVFDRRDDPDLDLDRAGRRLDQNELEQLVPDADDVADGWVRDPDSEDDDSEGNDELTSTSEECEAVFDTLEGEEDHAPAASSTHAFVKDDLGPFLTVEVESYDEELSSGLDEVVEALENCPGWTVTDDDGTTIEFEASGLSFPNFGEETLALRLKATADDWPIAMDMVLVHAGHNVVTAAYTALGKGDDVELLEKIVRKTMENLAA